MQTSVELHQRIQARQQHEAILNIRAERHARRTREYQTAARREQWHTTISRRITPALAALMLAWIAYDLGSSNLPANTSAWWYALGTVTILILALLNVATYDYLAHINAQQRDEIRRQLRGWVEVHDDDTLTEQIGKLGPSPSVSDINTALYDHTVGGRW